MQAIVTLRSRKQVDNQVALPKENPVVEREEESHNKLAKDSEPNTAIPTVDEYPKKFVPKAHYPESLKAPKKGAQFADIFDVFKQVQIASQF